MCSGSSIRRKIGAASFLGWSAAFLCAVSLHAAAAPLDVESVIAGMRAAYAAVKDYQALMEVRKVKSDGSVEIQKFLYSFKKPGLIRLDFESPHPGMVLIYPDKEGKVLVRFAGLAHFLPLHLSPDNPRLMVSAGQRIDQTDMGLLIANIAHSLTDERRGQVSIAEDEKLIHIRVLALNHFCKDMVTLYRFSIDKTLFLPVEVEESTPGGRLERVLTFENLRLNINMPHRFLEGG